jgi:DNA mismatch endonuclease (patch repair protein)
VYSLLTAHFSGLWIIPVVDSAITAERSRLMAGVRTKHTGIELIVRRLAHSLGYRYRLHRTGMPGTPDLIFPSRRKVIFVHGCFWHRHTQCAKGSIPKTRRDFWEAKLAKNVSRDQRVLRDLNVLGWQALVVWECELKDRDVLATRLRDFLGPPLRGG